MVAQVQFRYFPLHPVLRADVLYLYVNRRDRTRGHGGGDIQCADLRSTCSFRQRGFGLLRRQVVLGKMRGYLEDYEPTALGHPKELSDIVDGVLWSHMLKDEVTVDQIH